MGEPIDPAAKRRPGPGRRPAAQPRAGRRKGWRGLPDGRVPAMRDTPTPLGPMRLAACDGTLVGAWFVDQADAPPLPAAATQAAPEHGGDADHAVLDQAESQLQAWFRGERTAFDVPLAAHGTPFQQSVWRALCEVPFGAVISYGRLAARVGRPRAVRAVAQAVGANPISLFIPCHRIVGHDTSLTGFGGGLMRKRALLAHEGHPYAGEQERSRYVHPGQLPLDL